jgi:hypothetical protein
MRFLRTIVTALCALGLSGCLRSQEPLNPPQLVTASDTDMAVQLFMQATILLGRYYGFDTLQYADLTDRSVRRGYQVLPFMPPVSRRATPNFTHSKLKFRLETEGEDEEEAGKDVLSLGTNDFRKWANKLALTGFNGNGNRLLIAYYVQTGWRAAQLICRNYLVGLEEQNSYLDFLRREFDLGTTLANASLIAAGANVTLRAVAVAVQFAGDGALDSYQRYRFLDVDRDAARALVEAAQSAVAVTFIKGLSSGKITPRDDFVIFSDAVQAVSAIEYQCTRSGIRGLLTQSATASKKKLVVDQVSGILSIESPTPK